MNTQMRRNYFRGLSVLALMSCILSGCIKTKEFPPNIIVCIADDASFPHTNFDLVRDLTEIVDFL